MAELTSWKEIAGYLDVSVRTAQMWEAQRGLPVRRMPGPRSRVLATTEELDEWKLSGTGPAVTAASPVKVSPAVEMVVAPRWEPSWKKLGIGATVAVVLVGAVVIGRQGRERTEFGSFDPIPLTSGMGQEMKPSLSPDGMHVAYLERAEGAESYEAVSRDLQSGERRVLVRGLTAENSVHWSPGGDRLAATRMERGRVVLTVVPAAGGTARDLQLLQGEDRTFNAMESLRVGWMNGGREICYSDRDAAGEPLGLFVTNADRRGRRRLTQALPTTAGDVQCTPSPDGKQVAYVKQQTVSEGDVYVLDLGTGAQRRVTRMSGHFMGLSWLPDGTGLLAGCGTGSTGTSIWLLSTEGLEPKRLTGRETKAAYPSVVASGGGFRAVYQVTNRDLNIWRWTSDGKTKRVTDSVLVDHYPAVNAKGELAWISWRSGPPEVWMAGPGGENPVRMSFLGGPYVDFPRWSPNGQFLVYATMHSGTRDLFLTDRARQTALPIEGRGSEEGRGSFSRDGRRLYFRSDRSGTKEIWRRGVESRTTAEQVTEGGGYEAFEDPSGKWVYYVREREKPGLWRVAADGGKGEFVDGDVWEGRWAVAEDGIYVLHQAGPRMVVERMGWTGGVRTRVMEMEPGKTVEAGLAVSWDGKSIYWSQLDRMDADLMTALVR